MPGSKIVPPRPSSFVKSCAKDADHPVDQVLRLVDGVRRHLGMLQQVARQL
jgi:hypothetical protein